MLQNLRVFQRIPVLNGEAGDVVEDHVHDADRPDGAIRVLPVERKVIGILTLLLDILVALNKKAAGADSGIVDFIARTRLHELYQKADHLAGGIELTAFFTGAVGKEFD